MKQETQVKNQKTSNTGFVLLVMLLITITVISSSIGLYAWSRYQKSDGNNAMAQVAKWHFELTVGEQEETGYTLLALTRTQGSEHVVEEKLAPGTSGVIPIEIDTRETEVTMTYDVIIRLRNCPVNMNFYADEGKTQKLERTKEQVEIEGETVEVDVIKISKYLSLDMVGVEPNRHTEVDDVHKETIYWDWPYETITADGTGNQTSVVGDEQDTLDQGKTIQIAITAIGTEVLENPRTLAAMVRNGEVQIGDIVKYDPLKGMSNTDIAGIGTYTAKETSTDAEANASENNPTTGYSSPQEFNVNTNKITTWRVLGINDNGEVELMGITPNTIYFKGQAGYNNGITIMNNIAKIYGHGAGARSMTVEDVEQYTSFDKTTYSGYGNTKQYTFDNTGSYTGIKAGVEFTIEDINGNLIKDTNERTNLIKGSVATVQQTYYSYSITSNKKAGIPNNAYTMLTAGNYWLASRFCTVNSSECYLGLRCVVSGYVNGDGMFFSSGYVDSGSRAVAPVVSLRSNIQISGGNASGWELDV